MVPYRRLQTLLRIKTQLMISVERRPQEEAVALYERSLGMDGKTASALVRSQTMNPGRTFSYYTGMRALRTLQRRLGVDDASFTEMILSNGFVSLATMNALLERRFGSTSSAGGYDSRRRRG
jgi:methylphosphotriester-DNA--protein-cysteine methyltransferase